MVNLKNSLRDIKIQELLCDLFNKHSHNATHHIKVYLIQ